MSAAGRAGNVSTRSMVSIGRAFIEASSYVLELDLSEAKRRALKSARQANYLQFPLQASGWPSQSHLGSPRTSERSTSALTAGLRCSLWAAAQSSMAASNSRGKRILTEVETELAMVNTSNFRCC